MTVVERAREAVQSNWPIKLTALGLATVFWALVAAEEPTTQLMTLPVTVQLPQGRPLTGRVPDVEVVFTGSARELLKLYATPAVIRKAVPDTFADSVYTLQLSTADVEIPKHVVARTQEVRPRSVQVRLANAPPVAVRADSAGLSERVLMGVPVVVHDESGASWSSDPLAVIVTVHGPAPRLARLTRDSVEVAAAPTGGGRPETVQLRVAAPEGIEASATPDTALVQRRARG